MVNRGKRSDAHERVTPVRLPLTGIGKQNDLPRRLYHGPLHAGDFNGGIHDAQLEVNGVGAKEELADDEIVEVALGEGADGADRFDAERARPSK
jgi:hypothetical protein